VLQAMAGIAAAYSLQSYKQEIVDGDGAAVMSDVSFTQRATNRTMRFRVANFLRFRGRQADRVPRVHKQLRRGRAGARARIAAVARMIPKSGNRFSDKIMRKKKVIPAPSHAS
jgi:hypothetical protein